MRCVGGENKNKTPTLKLYHSSSGGGKETEPSRGMGIRKGREGMAGREGEKERECLLPEGSLHHRGA